jgi:hypothetical protein
MRAQQKLKGPYRMSLVAVLHDWPRAECTGHGLLLSYIEDYGVPHLLARLDLGCDKAR